MSFNYINQAEIDEVQAAVAQVWPDLKVAAHELNPRNTKQVIAVEVFVPEKGNKAKIQALKELGFRKVRRELKGPPGYSPYFYLSGERSYYVTLRKDL